MIFRFMEKYRVPILVVLLLGLVGFGVWTFVLDAFQDKGADVDPDEVVAAVDIGGETHEMTFLEYDRATRRAQGATEQERAGVAMAALVQEAVLAKSGVVVSDEEYESAFKTGVREPMEQANDGKFDEKLLTTSVNRFYGLTLQDFKRAMREDMRLAKLFGEVNRVNGILSADEVYETYKKVFMGYKLKGVFFDDAQFVEAAKLERDADGNLTAAANTKLGEYWSGLEEAKRKQYNKDGAELTADFAGVRFHGDDRTDDDLLNLFEKESAFSKKSLKDLTAEYEPTEADLAKMKLRLDRHRDDYGIQEDDETELDALFEAHKQRLTIEWKILKHIKKVHTDIFVDVAAKKDVDLEKVARENNLTYFKFSGIKLNDLISHEDYPGNYPRQMLRMNPGQFLNYVVALGEQADAYFAGPVDEVGRHASIWRLVEKNLNPMPKLLDVRDAVIEDYEKQRATELREEATEAFDGLVDAYLEEKVKDFAKPIRDEAAAAIAEKTKDLNSEDEADKAKIEEITKEENDKAEAKVDAEKDKYRTEAFKDALAKTKGLVVEEGFFNTMDTRGETAVDREKATSEEKARAAVRKEFNAILDDIFGEREAEIGDVSDWVTSSTYPGLAGRAILVAKKEPSVEDMALDPQGIQMAEAYVNVLNRRNGAQESMWTYENLKKQFNIDTAKIDKRIEEDLERQRETERLIEERKKQLEERRRNAQN